MKELHELESSLKYVFKNKSLLKQSLSHPSLKHSKNSKDQITDYERLELLGDSILNFVITEALFKDHKNFDEGKLAKIRSLLVCKSTIHKVATNIGIASYIIMTEGEESSGGRENINNIENATEAILAAIYLDSDISMVNKVIIHHWQSFLANVSSIYSDAKTALQEWSQEQFHIIPEYTLATKTGPAHAPFFTVNVTVATHYAEGAGTSIKAAEKDAAKNLLNKIGITKYHHE